ncbi:TPA: acylphosphatase [Pseudomonas aeruginosa]|nr:acylphosphatase [Pseudomonas aeruginosa]
MSHNFLALPSWFISLSLSQATREEADRLELDGWVRNLDDGRVEVVWEGEEDRAKALERWLGRGPRHAEVSAVEVEQMPLQGIAGFVVRR